MDQLPSSNELKRKKPLEQLPTTKKRLLRQDDCDASDSGDLAVEESSTASPTTLPNPAIAPVAPIPAIPSTPAPSLPSPPPHAVSRPLTPPPPLPTPIAPPISNPPTTNAPLPAPTLATPSSNAAPTVSSPANDADFGASSSNTSKAEEKSPNTNLLMQRGTTPITAPSAPAATTTTATPESLLIEANPKPVATKSVNEVPIRANNENAANNLSQNAQAGTAGGIKLNADDGGSGALGVLTEYGAPKEEPSTGLRGLFPFALMIVLFLIILSVVVYIVPTLREKVAAKLPPALGKYLVNVEQVIEKVSVQPQPIVYDEKTQSATLSGIVTNLTDAPVSDIQLEFTFARRNDIRQTEIKLIPIEPATLGPKAQGNYKFTVSTKDFQENSVTKVLSQQTVIKFRKLSPVQPVDPDPNVPNTPTRPRSNKTTSDDGVYEGTVE
jgi:hypothetical protein